MSRKTALAVMTVHAFRRLPADQRGRIEAHPAWQDVLSVSTEVVLVTPGLAIARMLDRDADGGLRVHPLNRNRVRTRLVPVRVSDEEAAILRSAA